MSKAYFGVSMDENLRDAIDILADTENRGRSNMIACLCREAIKARVSKTNAREEPKPRKSVRNRNR